MTEWRIEFSIQQRDDGAEDFVEIGFGSSGAWSDLNQAAYEVESAIQNREWETSGDTPETTDSSPKTDDRRTGHDQPCAGQLGEKP